MMNSEKLLQVVDAKLNAVRGEFVVLVEQLKESKNEPGIDLRAKVIERAVQMALDELRTDKKVRPIKGHKRVLRHWTMAQKKHILVEAEQAKVKGWGNQRLVCEKYGITTAHLTQWKSQLKAPARHASASAAEAPL